MIVSAVIEFVTLGLFVATLVGATAMLGWVLLVALPVWVRLVAAPLVERWRHRPSNVPPMRRPLRNTAYRSAKRPHLIVDPWADVDLWADLAWLYRARGMSSGA